MKLPPLDGYIPSALKPRKVDTPVPSSINATPSPAKPDFASMLADSRSALQTGNSTRNLEQAEQVANDIEAFMLSMVFKFAMSKHISKGIYGDSYQSGMFLDMFIDAVAKDAVSSKGLGIADMVLNDINRIANSVKVEVGDHELEELPGMRKDDAGDD